MKNILVKTTLGISLVGMSVMASQVSLDDKIAGLYVGFFHRAPDYSGLKFWKQKALNNRDRSGSSSDAVLREIAEGFAQHPIFTRTYSDLNNTAYVEEIYRNVLGRDGDPQGIQWWSHRIEEGELNRADMVSEFVTGSLTADITPENFPSLSPEQLEKAKKRQDYLKHKVDVAVEFAKELKEESNVKDAKDPDNDPAYKASIDILKDVNDSQESVEGALALIYEVNGMPNAADLLLKKHAVKENNSTEEPENDDEDKGEDIDHNDLNGMIYSPAKSDAGIFEYDIDSAQVTKAVLDTRTMDLKVYFKSAMDDRGGYTEGAYYLDNPPKEGWEDNDTVFFIHMQKFESGETITFKTGTQPGHFMTADGKALTGDLTLRFP